MAKELTAQATEPLLDAVGAGPGMVIVDMPTGAGAIVTVGSARARR